MSSNKESQEGDEAFMRLALTQAERAVVGNDVPVGAVLIAGTEVLAAAANEREARGDPTAHAEILVLQAASRALRTWRLEATTMYVTLEPCPMCAGALVSARVARLVYGPQDARAGAAYSLYNILQDPRLNHHVEITSGVLAEESAQLLRSFFQRKRR